MIEELLKIGGSAGVGAAVIFILAKSGILKVSIGKNGNNGYQLQIDELKEHSRIANNEMGEIRKDISDIKADVSFIKGLLSKNV